MTGSADPSAGGSGSSGGCGCCAADNNLRGKLVEWENRSVVRCPDCVWFGVYALLVLMWIAIAGYAYHNGEPDRLILGTDYLGGVCGKSTYKPQNWDAAVSAAKDSKTINNALSPLFWQSEKWEENTKLWYPIGLKVVQELIASNAESAVALTNLTATKAPKVSLADRVRELVNLGVCVNRCPKIQDYTDALKNANVEFNWNEMLDALTRGETFDFRLIPRIWTYGIYNRKNKIAISTLDLPTYYEVVLDTQEEFNRCVPDMDSSMNSTSLITAIKGVPKATEVTEWFFKGITEVVESWKVFILCAFLCLIFAFLYLVVMSRVAGLMVWCVIFLTFACQGVIIGLCYFNWQRLKNQPVTQQKDRQDMTDNAKFWQAWMTVFAILLFLHVCITIFLRKDIEHAVAIVKMATRVIYKANAIMVIPIGGGLFMMLVTLWFLFVGVFLYTTTEFKQVAHNYTGLVANATNVINQQLQSDTALRNLVSFDIFMFLWTIAVVNSVVYMTICIVTTMYYYSYAPFNPQGREEKDVANADVKFALWYSLKYHLSTLVFGSFFIAAVQMIRLAFHYYEKVILAKLKGELPDAFKKFAELIVSCSEACLACFEKVVKYATRQAYCYAAVTDSSFCPAVCGGLREVLNHVLTSATTFIISELIMFLGKVIVVCATTAVAWGMCGTDLAPKVEIKIFPCIIVMVMSYALMELFTSVYCAVIDQLLMCSYLDESYMDKDGQKIRDSCQVVTQAKQDPSGDANANNKPLPTS